MKEYKYKINGNAYKVTIGDIEDNIAHVEVKVCDHFLSAVLADRQAQAPTADKKQALDFLPPTLPQSTTRN